MERLNAKKAGNFCPPPIRAVQFGEGNFLRAFADWMIDIMNEKAGFDAGVAVVQPRRGGRIGLLREQDGLYTVYLRGLRDGSVVNEHRLIRCVAATVDPYAEPDRFYGLAEEPELEFVLSNTTEAGIVFDENDRAGDRPPQSFPGKLAAFLYRRYQAMGGSADSGLIVLPCELIERNGDRLRECVLRYARHWALEEGFDRWIGEACVFCNTLVDRIVPGYPRERIAEVQAELGYDDRQVAEGEPYHLWVIEGPEWIARRIPFEKAGLNVRVTGDLSPYRTRKVRILNGAHTAMVPVAYLYGIDTVREAVEDPVIGRFVRDILREEILPTLDMPREELDRYAADVLERFRNPYIRHELMSISLNSISKYKTRLLPSLLAYGERKGRTPRRLAFSLAALLAFYRGDRDGTPIALSDDPELLVLFKALWGGWDGSPEGVRSIVREILAQEKHWGTDLNAVPGLTDRVAADLAGIVQYGMRWAAERQLS